MKAKKIVALMLALVMVLALGTSALAATGDMSNPVTVSGVTLRFGDPNYPATAPEKYMYFKETGTGTYDAIYSTDGTTEDASYYPDILAFYVVPEEVNGEPVAITSITGTGIDFVTYDASGNATISPTVAVNDDGFYTIKPKSDNSSITVNGNVTVSFSAPNVQIAEGSKPAAVTGYLPVGQFARYNSFGWGNLYTDNTNIKSTSNTTKFLDGYVSTGVSLGMAGGYIQFDMGTHPIENNAKNPYGIDFIVYGNAFVGNPEAACVMVSNNGTEWFTLAGSRHYMSDTLWNQKISYVRIEGDQKNLNTSFGGDGVYYSTNYVSPSEQTQTAINAAISAATWQGIPAASSSGAVNLSYWPEWANRTSAQAENYGNVWKIGTDPKIPAVAATANNAGVNWDKADKVSTEPNGAEVITYSGLTIVPDDTVVLKNQGITSPSQAQMTDVYQWGYADVRVNGTAYGTAINPYASAASVGNGGDGFDLSWAVDANGVPHPMTSARYIRVYSAVLFNAGIFGETSAEVCGLYVANAESSSVGTSANVELWADEAEEATPMNLNNTTSVAAGTYYLYSTETNVYVNGEKVTVSGEEGCAITIAAGQKVQIIAQSGTAAPFLTVLYGE